MTIQLFVPKFRVEECLEGIRECLEKGWTGLGFKTVQMEDAWKAYTGLANAHFLSSNTVGLHLALEVFKKKHGWDDGDEVIAPPMTFVSTNHAIMYANLKPVFADCDDYGCICPVAFEKAITPKTRAIMFVGLGGNIGQYQKIKEICKARNIILILDAAHMAGTRINGQHVCPEADCCVFSFQAVKNMPTADSGMICFKELDDDQYVRKLTWLGINKDTFARTAAQGAYKWMYDVEEVGYKYHGNSIMAAIGLVSLKYLDQDNAYRRQLAKWYREDLNGAQNLRIIETAPDCESAQHLFQIRATNRNDLLAKLNGKDIYPGVHYRDNTHYRMYEYGHATCPNARKLSDEVLSLPMHMGISREDVREICKYVREFAEYKTDLKQAA